MPSHPHKQLAARLAADIAIQLEGLMPEIARSVLVADKARYVATINFSGRTNEDGSGHLKATLSGVPTFALPKIERKLSMASGQLSLWEGEPADAEERDADEEPFG